MEEEKNEQQFVEDMKELVRQHIKDAYLEGVNRGAITTCAIIYSTMLYAVLEEGNIIYVILKDLAQQHGCNNLLAEVEKMKENIPTQ